MFPDRERFTLVSRHAARLRDAVAARYGRLPHEVLVFVYEPALAVKISLPRDLVSGDADDRDVYGAQQHRPLLDIEL
jgi:hypothetical protein